MGKHSRLVVGLDVGTTKICAVIGEVSPEGDLEVVGLGHRPSKGLHKGVIVEIESARDAIMAVLEDAEVMAGARVDAAYVGISGRQVVEVMAEGTFELRSQAITAREVQQVIEKAQSVLEPGNREILHVVPQEFTLDGEEGIVNPIGLSGAKLGVRVKVMTAPASVMETLRQVMDLTRVEVREVVARQLASAEGVLTGDEKELGVGLIDIGGSNSDIAVYRGGRPQYIRSLGVGGNHVTHDLAVGLRTPVSEAERLKQQFGCALLSLVKAEEMVEVGPARGKEGRVFPRKFLAEIIEARVEEIFALALHQIQQGGFQAPLSGGIVLTGGASVMPGMVQAAEAVFEMPVRLGLPRDIGGLTDLISSPTYAAGVGLAKYGWRRLLEGEAPRTQHLPFGRLFRRLAYWVQEIF